MNFLLLLLLSLPLYAFDKAFIESVKKLKDPVTPTVECADPEVPLYCQDFQKAVCQGIGQDEQEARLLEKQNGNKKFFIAQMIKADPSMKKKVQAIYDAPIMFGDDDGMDELLQDWALESPTAYKAVLAATANKIFKDHGLTPAELTSTYKIAQDGIKRAIAELSIPDMKKKQFISLVGVIPLIDTPTYFSKIIDYAKKKNPDMTPAEIIQDTILAYTEVCGPDGTHLQIFTVPNEFVYICPGMLLYLSESTSNKEELLNSLFLFFSHEFSHTPVNSELFNPSLKACYQDKIGVTDYDRFTPRQKLGMWDLQWKEIGSDTLASRAVANELLKTNLRGEALAQKLRQYTLGLCAQRGQVLDEEHPGASLRMEIFARHPLIRERMGCKTPDPQHKSCQIP